MGGRAFNVGHLQKVNVSLIYPNLVSYDMIEFAFKDSQQSSGQILQWACVSLIQ